MCMHAYITNEVVLCVLTSGIIMAISTYNVYLSDFRGQFSLSRIIILMKFVHIPSIVRCCLEKRLKGSSKSGGFWGSL